MGMVRPSRSHLLSQFQMLKVESEKHVGPDCT